MPAINFKAQFADMVESGRKTQTIRKPRKRPVKVGDTVHLFTGQRTKACRKIGEGMVVETRRVVITAVFIWVDSVVFTCESSLDEIAHNGGFNSWDEMVEWFQKTHKLPFDGDFIRWELKG